MIRGSLMRAAAALLFLAAAVAGPASAQAAGQEVEGVITAVELQGSPRTVTVRKADGTEIKAGIANRTRVVFEGAAHQYSNPDLNFLKPGLTVRFKMDPDTVERIHVVSVPADYKAPDYADRKAGEAGSAASGREVKVRIIQPAVGNTFVADVAGRQESFRLKEGVSLQTFGRGDLVVVTLEGAPGAEVVSSVRSAAVTGRIVSVDRRSQQVTVEVDGRTETYYFDEDDDNLRNRLRVGQTLRLEIEERANGRRVITGISQ